MEEDFFIYMRTRWRLVKLGSKSLKIRCFGLPIVAVKHPRMSNLFVELAYILFVLYLNISIFLTRKCHRLLHVCISNINIIFNYFLILITHFNFNMISTFYFLFVDFESDQGFCVIRFLSSSKIFSQCLIFMLIVT